MSREEEGGLQAIKNDSKSPPLEESRKWVQTGCILMKNMNTFIKTHANDINNL
jgi:hypothetical protein